VIVLETERLLLRRHELQDLDAFCAMEMDADIRRFVGGRPRTREEAEAKFRGGPPLCAMVLKVGNRYIGRCGFHPMPGGGVGIGFYVARSHWGLGLATEAARAFIDYGFREMKLKRILASVEVGNDASVRVLEKLGFKRVRHEEGQRRSFDHFELTAGPS
jgi:ribosomal-protein-alanine N-acetyltransferase